MWFFLIKSIIGAILGQATNSWFKKTKMGMWVYKKVDSWYNWAAKRYDLDVLTKEEKMIKKFPALTAKINKLEDEIAKLKSKVLDRKISRFKKKFRQNLKDRKP